MSMLLNLINNVKYFDSYCLNKKFYELRNKVLIIHYADLIFFEKLNFKFQF